MKRVRAARSDASISAIRKKIEEAFDLPEGSVQIIKPSGKNIRKDAKVAKLRKAWED